MTRNPERGLTLPWRVVWASTIGNALEWFDFTVFGLFSPTIGKLFFPSTDPTAALLSTYGLLAVGFLTRPLGGLFFGIWADRMGRKRALIAVVLLMAFGTAMIGVMPTYASIGIAAPLGLLMARLIQGFSAGGEFGSSTAMLLEFAPAERRTFFASFQFVAQALAFALGTLCAFVLNTTLSAPALESWGWRLPFLAGLIIAPVGFLLRRAIDETPEFQAFLDKAGEQRATPLRTAVTDCPGRILAALFLLAGPTANLWVGTVFFPNFATAAFNVRLADVQFGLVLLSLAQALLYPMFAALADRFGRLPLMLPGAVLYLVVSTVLIAQLFHAPSIALVWSVQAAGLFLALFNACLPAAMTQILPVGVRSTGASISYNLSVMLFGGLAPVTTAWLVARTGSQSAPFIYVGVCVMLSVGALIWLSDRRRDASINASALPSAGSV